MNLTISPFRRLREATGFSKAYFYKNAGLSESALTFVEAGLYTKNPPAADQELLRMCSLKGVPYDQILNEEYGEGTIPAATLAWQRAVRASLAAKVAEGFKIAREHPDETLSPVVDFAQHVSGTKTGFCKALKIQVGPFYQFDSGIVNSMPKSLYAALSDAGMTQRQLDELETEQEQWLRGKVPAVTTVELVD